MPVQSIASKETTSPRQGLIEQPEALDQLASGFFQLSRLLALTLGPNQGVVINARNGHGDPELLSDSAVIAMRVIQLPGRGEDAGAMLLRGMVADLEERYGDGAATASVLAEAMIRRGVRLLAAGANPMSLRRGIERATAAAVAELRRLSRPLDGQPAFTRLAVLATGDAALGGVLGEMFDLLGPYGAVVIQDFYTPYLDREYLSGGRWTGRPAAREFLPQGNLEMAHENALILVANQEIETPEQIQPVLEMAVARQPRQPMLFFARNIKSLALTTLLMNTARGMVEAAGLIPAGNLFRIEEDLADMALLTGARMLDPNAGDTLERFQPGDLGHAQRVMFTQQDITIVGGGGNPAALQKRVGELRARFHQIKRLDPEWEKLRLRTARLSGGVGILKIGAAYEKQREMRKEAARKAIRMLSAAGEEGVLPGGGVAYLNCRAAARAVVIEDANPDETLGVEIVASALEAPFRQIVANFGRISPPVALARATQLGPGYGLDVTSGQYVEMEPAGIVDGASVLQGALQAAASAATMLLTTAAIVLHKEN